MLSSPPLEQALETHRRELTGYCYRMLGLAVRGRGRGAGDDAARLARASSSFEGRAALRSWLYRIATNVCLDMLNGRERRARPMDLGPAQEPLEREPAHPPGDHVAAADPGRSRRARGSRRGRGRPRHDPTRVRRRAAASAAAAARRADPLRGAALAGDARSAELLDTSVASVNSALQRARATLEERDVSATQPLDDAGRALLARYVDGVPGLRRRPRSPRCFARTRSSRCRRSTCGSRVGTTCSRGGSGPASAAAGSRVLPRRGCERLARVRPVQAGRGRRLRAVGAAGGRAVRRADRASSRSSSTRETLFPLFGLPPRLEPEHLRSGRRARSARRRRSAPRSTQRTEPARLAASLARAAARVRAGPDSLTGPPVDRKLIARPLFAAQLLEAAAVLLRRASAQVGAERRRRRRRSSAVPLARLARSSVSSYSVAATLAGPRRSASASTSTVHSCPSRCGSPADRPPCTSFAGFTRAPFRCTWPPSTDSVASARVLKKRAAQSHLSRRTVSTLV